MPRLPFLLSPDRAHQLLNQTGKGRVVPVSAAWFLPNAPKTGYESFRERRIAGSRFFDLDGIKDERSKLPHMLPSAAGFASAMTRLGIARSDRVIVYDSAELGIFSAPRVAWMFRLYGHGHGQAGEGGVHILDNFREWVRLEYPTVSGLEEETSGGAGGAATPAYELGRPGMVKGMVVGFDEVRRIAQATLDGVKTDVVILDARSRMRWAGTDPEPRPGLPSGHIPGSISVPFTDVLDSSRKTFKSAEELRELFAARGLSAATTPRVISSCGTGVTAAVVDTALELAGFPAAARQIYDGSWTEWAQRAGGPLIEVE